ncbi:fibrinogen-like YCDxxxxGGGW domain-containing protein [Neptuniibacter sp. QD37_11]|uniref:fibrinogen-like YCDxxxxGGGW domain-containing protein n=1 Tax=Neptuniibacter sp. QD37_11 TaxID=3398209 RepID=UPI0039F4970D
MQNLSTSFKALALAALAATPIAAHADFVYRTPAGMSVSSASEEPPAPTGPASCKAILDAGDSIGSGQYNIVLAGESIRTHCDMTTAGGGWTLVQTRNRGGAYQVSTDLHTAFYETGTDGNASKSLSDAGWMEIRDASTDMMQMNESNTSHYGIISLTKAYAANCKPLGDTLMEYSLWHHEPDCDSSQTDYSFMGANSTTWHGSLYNYSGYLDVDTMGSWYGFNHSYIYVR